MFSQALLALVPLLATLVSGAPTERHTAVQVIDNCKNSGQIALTFDDGPSPAEFEYPIVDSLNTVGAKATFFLNNWGCIYDNAKTVRDLYHAGHIIGSHTWSHPHLSELNETQINQEFEKLETAFIKILGVKPLFARAPYGEYNQLVLKVLAERGYTKLFQWSHDSGDTLGYTIDQQKAVYDSIAKSYPAPALTLQHSVKQDGVTVSNYSVPLLTKAGYKLVTLPECLGTNEWPYEYVGEPQQPDATWVC